MGREVTLKMSLLSLSRCCTYLYRPSTKLPSLVRPIMTSLQLNHEEKKPGKEERQAKILKEKTPLGKLEEQPNVHPAQEKDPLPEHPGGVNPVTGEFGGPKGPEPTRYGDWERKGRVTDF